MPTGACGINCDVCRLKIQGICGSCGPARSPEADEKMVVQERVLGAPCPILACAHRKGVSHCMKDCEDFPCNRLKDGGYPFSPGYLQMQERRWQERHGTEKAWVRGKVRVPSEYWQTLVTRDSREVSSLAMVSEMPPKGWVVPFLHRNILVDRQTRCIFKEKDGSWEFVDNPMLELLCLVYLLNVGRATLCGERVGAADLKTGHFFKGPHKIDVEPLLSRFGKDAGAFRTAAEALDGVGISMGDMAYRFLPFPKVPLYYVLWLGDREFSPNFSILFDRSIESHLKADAILGLVDLVSDLLCHGTEEII